MSIKDLIDELEKIDSTTLEDVDGDTTDPIVEQEDPPELEVDGDIGDIDPPAQADIYLDVKDEIGDMVESIGRLETSILELVELLKTPAVDNNVDDEESNGDSALSRYLGR